MSAKFSTGLRQYLANEGCMRECFEDSVIRIYPGQAPDSADDAEVANILCVITADGEEVSDDERSTPGVWKLTLQNEHENNATVALKITVGSTLTEYLHTNNPDLDLEPMCALIAEELSDIHGIVAVSVGTGGVIMVKGSIAGEDIDIQNDDAPVGSNVVTCLPIIVAARSDALYFDAGVLGVMDKADAIDFIGENILGGTAGHFRLVRTNDTGEESQTEERVQGNCSTSGSEMNLSSLLFVLEADTKLKTFRITFPEV